MRCLVDQKPTVKAREPPPSFRAPMIAIAPARTTQAAVTSLKSTKAVALCSKPFRAPSRVAAPFSPHAKADEGSHAAKTFLGPSFKKQRLSVDPIVTRPNKTVTVENSETNKESDTSSHFVCLYRKIQSPLHKKNPNWEGDGFLVLFSSQSGTMAVLKDSTSGKTLGSTTLGSQVDLRSNTLLKVGGRQIEIQRPATAIEIQSLESGENRCEEVSWSSIVKNDGRSIYVV